MKNDPEIKNLLNTFPGVTIHSITNINQTTEEKKLTNEIKKMKEK